ncbi:MAG: RluA family pseudouridine synthase [Phycisphaerales bacterium]|nr:RluA family pseudouridine synthase [Phycisphaerales bacterium]
MPESPGQHPGRRPERAAIPPSGSEIDQPLIRRGGLVDVDALRKAVHAPTLAAAEPEAVAPDETIEAAEGPPTTADDDAPNRVVFTLQRDLQKRLDKYLTDRIPFMSRTQLQRLIDEGGVKVNDRAPKASTKLGLGDRVEVFIPPPPAHDVPPQDIPLDVLFEDEHLIVLNKQADIIVHPARSHLSGTMINALAFHFQNRSAGALSGVGREFARPGVVHRLDRHTSGVIVFAKTEEAHWKIATQFERRTVDKRYLAVVRGLVEPAIDVIDLPLGPHPSREKGYREKYVVRHDHLGKAAVTIYRVLETARTHAPVAADYSIIEVELKTGRTHQIRVHFSHLGYPLVGDDMYGGKALPLPDGSLFARQALHAATLAFRHPITNDPMSFAAPLPPDLRALITALRPAPPDPPPAPPPGSTLCLDGLLAPRNTRTPSARDPDL